jgi:hypothetical protein
MCRLRFAAEYARDNFTVRFKDAASARGEAGLSRQILDRAA